jgi:hypothetical protein
MSLSRRKERAKTILEAKTISPVFSMQLMVAIAKIALMGLNNVHAGSDVTLSRLWIVNAGKHCRFCSYAFV